MAGGRKRYVKGDRAFRRVLTRLPDAAKEEIVRLLGDVGDEVVPIIRADTPARTGKLRSAISKKVLPGAMRLKVGLIGKPINRRLFYGNILDKGRRAQTVSVTRRGKAAIARFGKRLSRGRKVGADIVSTYRLRVRPLSRRGFVSRRMSLVRAAVQKRIGAFWDRTLAKASSGATDG